MERVAGQEESRHKEPTRKVVKHNLFEENCSQLVENWERNKFCENKPENVPTNEHKTNFRAIPKEGITLSSLFLTTVVLTECYINLKVRAWNHFVSYCCSPSDIVRFCFLYMGWIHSLSRMPLECENALQVHNFYEKYFFFFFLTFPGKISWSLEKRPHSVSKMSKKGTYKALFFLHMKDFHQWQESFTSNWSILQY